jgi:hypothetical protein
MRYAISAQTLVAIVLVCFVRSAGAQVTRPTPMGVEGSNGAVSSTTFPCFGIGGTLGALVADQNGTEYILSNAHVFAVGPSGFFANGYPEPITQPSPFGVVSTCEAITPALIASIQVATLSTVAPLNFDGSMSQADAAIAKVLPDMASSSISEIPFFSGVQLKVVKKNLQVQMTGAASGNTIGHVISKMLMPADVTVCQHIPTAKGETKKTCGLTTIKLNNTFDVKPGNFAQHGDSGALVLTVGPCPQPVGVLVSGNGSKAVVEAIGSTLNALQSAGGYSSLSIIPGGTSCTPSVTQIQVPGGSSSDWTLEDPTVADPDVAQALVVLPDLTSALAYLIDDGWVDGIGIDLSGSVASLDVVWDSAADEADSPTNIPSTYEGVPVEQNVIETYDLSGDTSDLQAGTN